MSLALVKMTEAELQSAVIEMAQLLGWRVAHFRPAQTSKGWRTPVEADGQGFPDLFCVRDDKALAIELKSDKGRVSDHQYTWLAAMEMVDGIDAHIIRPADWHSGLVKEILSGK